MSPRTTFAARLLAAGLGGLLSCDRTPAKAPDLVERSAVFLEDGRVIRVPAYRGEQPVLGQCVDRLTYTLSAGRCAPVVNKQVMAPRIAVKILDKQGFRESSQLIAVEADVEVGVGAQKLKSKTTVAKHRLFLEWNRYAVYSLDPFELTNGTTATYVSGIEYGVGIRIILDVSLTNVDADTKLNLSLGDLAAKVALGNARVAVQYDTIGVARDILPKDLPIAISSVNDITSMMKGLYGAIADISSRWNQRLDDAQGVGGPGVVAPPMKLPVKPPSPALAAGALAADQPSVPALIDDVARTRDALKAIPRKDRGDVSALFEADHAPRVGGKNFEALAARVERGGETSPAELDALLDNLNAYGTALQAIDPGVRQTKLKTVPEPLREPDSVTLLLNTYYPLLAGDERALFPLGFSAAPIAYYVARSPDDITRDYCDSVLLDSAAKHTRIKQGERDRCAKFWMPDNRGTNGGKPDNRGTNGVKPDNRGTNGGKPDDSDTSAGQ